MLLAFALLIADPALAQDMPLRPLTYNLDPKLTEGACANFRELYVDPASFVASLKPARPPTMASPALTSTAGASPDAGVATAVNAPPTGTLFIVNDRGSWAEVAVNGTRLGKIGPYIVGTVGPVPSGGYTVDLTYSNGYTFSADVATSNKATCGAFGGPIPAVARPNGDFTTRVSVRR